MATQVQKQHGKSSIAKYKMVIILAILPVVLAMYANGAEISGLLPTLTSGIFPVAFTLLSWGIAVQQLVHIRRK
ncbi:MAG: hypothetical protein ACE1YV_05045 [Nitrosopumilaceae archaeon]|jgi:hypothetical protein